MRTCWHCRKKIAPMVRFCPFCSADQTTPGTAPKAAQSLSAQQKALPVTRRWMVMGQGTRRAARWPWVVGALIISAIALIVALRPQPLSVEGLEPVEGEGSPCTTTAPVCIVAYFAPWAPASQRSLGTLTQLGERWEPNDVEIAWVVGSDTTEIMGDFAAQMPENAWLDADDTFLKNAAIVTSPTWFVVRGGRLRATVEGTFFPFNYHIQKLGLTDAKFD